LTVGIEDGTSQTVDLSHLDNPGTDDQVISLASNILTLENGGMIDLSPYLDDTDTDDQRISDFSIAGNTLSISIEDGNTETVNLSSLRSSVNPIVTVGNIIAIHDNGTATEDIRETVTSLSQNDSSPTGEITYQNEMGISKTAQVVAAENTNEITVGANGGAFFRSPVRAMGKVNADGSTNKAPYNATVSRTAQGEYLITLDAAAGITDVNYIIQLTVLDSAGAGNDDYDVSYRAQGTGSFVVQVGDNDNGGSDRANRDFQFMFTVLYYD